MITRSIDHQYTYEGRTYPGVTGILKIIDKSDALKAWAARMTAEAAVRSIEILPKMLETSGEKGVVSFLTARSNWVNEKARDLGTSVHELADRLQKGETLTGMTETETKYVEHYRKWRETSGWTIKYTECMVLNPTAGYGGTLDILARDAEGRSVLCDLKTGSNVYRETVCQLAAYGMAELIQVNGKVSTMPPIDRYAVLHITADGLREIEVPITVKDQQAFYACMALTEWVKATKGRL